MTPRRLLLLPVLALALTACGGESEDPKAAFVGKANEICSEADDDFAEVKQPTSVTGVATFAEEILDIAEKAQRELAALTPPEPDRAELEAKALTPFAALVEEGKGFVQKLKDANGDQAKLLPLLSQRPDPSAIDLEFLRAYGLGTCADAIDLAT